MAKTDTGKNLSVVESGTSASTNVSVTAGQLIVEDGGRAFYDNSLGERSRVGGAWLSDAEKSFIFAKNATNVGASSLLISPTDDTYGWKFTGYDHIDLVHPSSDGDIGFKYDSTDAGLVITNKAQNDALHTVDVTLVLGDATHKLSEKANLLAVSKHIDGTADRHTADMIDYSDTETVKAKLDKAAILGEQRGSSIILHDENYESLEESGGLSGGYRAIFGNNEIRLTNYDSSTNDEHKFIVSLREETFTSSFYEPSYFEVETFRNYKSHKLTEKANSSDVLTKANTAEFTPTADYHPATKKYVDDSAATRVNKVEGKSLIDSNVAKYITYNAEDDSLHIDKLRHVNLDDHTFVTDFSGKLEFRTFLNLPNNNTDYDGGRLTLDPSGLKLRSNFDQNTDVIDISQDGIKVSSCSGQSNQSIVVNAPLGEIKLITDGKTHKLSEKANTSDVLVKDSSGDFLYGGTTISQTEVATIGHALTEKANTSDVLTKTNTAEFTPTSDYHPATKKYVDDSVSSKANASDLVNKVSFGDNYNTSAAGASDIPITLHGITEGASTSNKPIGIKLNPGAGGGSTASITVGCDNSTDTATLSYNGLSIKSTTQYGDPNVRLTPLGLQLSNNSNMAQVKAGTVKCSVDNGNTWHELSEKANTSDVLTKTNTTAFTPTSNYHPATKYYVDNKFNNAAPAYTYSTTDLTAGTSSLATGKLYLVYE